MNIGNETFFLFGDHLCSASGVMNASGQIVEKSYYLPWGGTRGEETITSTDYRYTGWGDSTLFWRTFNRIIGIIQIHQADKIGPLWIQPIHFFIHQHGKSITLSVKIISA